MIPTIEHIKPLISRRTKSIITAVAIVLNLLIIASFLLIELNLDDTSLIRHLRKIRSVLKKRNPRKDEWAALSPKASRIGNAPVFLVSSDAKTMADRQAPSPTTQTSRSNQSQNQPTQQTNMAKNISSQNMQNEKQEENTTLASASNNTENSDHKELSEIKELKNDLSAEALAKEEEPTQLVQNVEATEKLEIEEKKENNNASVEQAIKAALAKKLREAMLQSTKNQQASSSAKASVFAKASPDRSADRHNERMKNKPVTQKPVNKQTLPQPTQQAQKQLTFAQLVKGFTEHLKSEGEYTISMQGKSGAKATEHQLRVGRFLQKIIQCMQTSWKVNKNRYPLNHRVLADIVVRVVINKDGSLNNLIVQKTSGRQIIDSFVLDILRDASKSFPPIPHYLNQEVCVITCNWEKIPLPDGPSGYTITR